MSRLHLRDIVQWSLFWIRNITTGFICGIFALRIFRIIYMYKISFIGLKHNWRKFAAVLSYYNCTLLHRNLPHQSCHTSAISTSVCASKDPQLDVLGMSSIDMVEFHILSHQWFLDYIHMQTSKKNREFMDRRNLHRRPQNHYRFIRLQCCFGFSDLDPTSTCHMESANGSTKKDGALGGLSCWYLVSLKRHFLLFTQ